MPIGVYKRTDEQRQVLAKRIERARTFITQESIEKLRQTNTGRHFPDREGGNETSFKKGRTPWNKGLKGIHLSPKSEFKKGENTGAESNFWKGGITPINQQVRNSFEYKQWRIAVFTRDDYTCRSCGDRGVKLNADHYPKAFAEIFHQYKIQSLEEALNCEEFWNINNGRTLCEDCHKTTDNYLNRWSNK